MQARNNTISTSNPQGAATCCSEIADLFDPILFKALSDPNRVAILATLSITAKEQTVSQVAELFDINFSVVSRHLKILKEARILSVRKDGKEVRYKVNSTLLASALRKMAEALEHCCGATGCDSQEDQQNG